MIKAVKGFNCDMTCTPRHDISFQYEEGKEYEEAVAHACYRGFHACELPIDAFRYYSPRKSVYHEVEMSGYIDHSEHNKTCSTKIRIGNRISIKGMIEASFNIIKNKALDRSPSSWNYVYEENSADNGVASSSIHFGKVANSGLEGMAVSSGDFGGAINSGYEGRATNSGNCGFAVNSGDRGTARVDRKDSCAIAFGSESKACGVIGSFLVLAEWGSDKKSQKYLKDMKVVRVDGVNIKENIWYQLKNGKVVEKGNLHIA